MGKWFNISTSTALQIFLSTLIIYIVVIFLTRIFGKRSFSKMSSFDFAMTVAVGSLIATTILSSNVSILEGAFGLFLVYTLQLLAAFFRRFKYVTNAIDNTPLLLMNGSSILYDNLKKARVTEGDLRAKLREANVLDLSQVHAVVFETTGDISVLHSDEDSVHLDPWLLKDVNRE
ncbi:DUF421 domain-containing protein [Aequorivita sp. H23M31]|uniref:DUF421 domain-containing protein n=1 Tax=Aequorivita ciconiae TaxID=2494375 RepID=A0A410G0W5_9FLAO|nr:YetF domain-containing protein [Aequorivita sp. H23M31]QAA80916.1 DUF421 domain-containing protein [Aequorivita sp. H23M31]